MDAATLDLVAAEARPRLISIAYRMVGSLSDAEDIVQDAMLRAQRAPLADVDTPVAYLTTITTRLAIDHLRSARVRRESYVGPWLPEPLLADPAPDASARAVLTDHLSMAFLVVLETLTPDERAVLVLHDVFACSHHEIAQMLERSEASSRQLLHRGRQRLAAGHVRAAVDLDRRDELVRRFVAVCEGGDLDAFLALLTDDAVLVADGGGAVLAARRPVRGADRVGRFLAHVFAKLRDGLGIELATVNGELGVAVLDDGRLTGVMFPSFSDSGRVATLHWLRNPAKLAALATALGLPIDQPGADRPAAERTADG